MSGRQRCRHHRGRSNQMAEPVWKSIMTIHLIRYCIKKFPDVTNRLRNRQDISSTDFLMGRNCIFQVLTMKEQILPAHIRKAKMDLNLMKQDGTDKTQWKICSRIYLHKELISENLNQLSLRLKSCLDQLNDYKLER